MNLDSCYRVIFFGDIDLEVTIVKKVEVVSGVGLCFIQNRYLVDILQ